MSQVKQPLESPEGISKKSQSTEDRYLGWILNVLTRSPLGLVFCEGFATHFCDMRATLQRKLVISVIFNSVSFSFMFIKQCNMYYKTSILRFFNVINLLSVYSNIFISSVFKFYFVIVSCSMVFFFISYIFH